MAAEPPDPEPRRARAIDELTPERILALGGVIALLTVGLVVLIMIAGAVGGDGDDGEREAATAVTPTVAATPTATPTLSPTPPPLTPVERAARAKAAELVRTRSFEVTRLRDYDPRAKLAVLIGRQGDNSRLAFFFVDGEYIGNDATDPSAELRVVKKTRTQVTLAYGIYAPGDEPENPTGGPVRVRFRWNGSRLEPRDPLPPPEQRTPGRGPTP